MKKTWTLIFFLLITGFAHAQLNVEGTTSILDPGLAEYFSDELRALSHDSLEGRNTLSEGIKKARKRIVRELDNMGVRPLDTQDGYLQAVAFVRMNGPEDLSLKVAGKSISESDQLVLLTGKEIDIKARVIYVGDGIDSIDPEILRGKIVVTGIGDGKQQNPMAWLSAGKNKKKLLQTSGAVGLIELFEPGRFPWQMVKNYMRSGQLKLDSDDRSFPHLWLNTADTMAVRTLTKDKLDLQLVISGYHAEEQIDHNIIGYIPGTDPELVNEMVMFSAHYDHVGIGRPDASGDTIYNGTRDNAVGVATLLGLARYFSEHPARRPLLFVFFTAEEKGLLGSEYFSAHSPVPLDRIRFNFNCDNGGYTDTDMLTVVGFHRLDGMEEIDQWIAPAGVRHFEPVELAQRLFNQSDNVHFARLGIPAPSISMGFSAFNDNITKYYHRAGDHYENFDREYMVNYWNGVLLLADHLVQLDTLPFWREDDPLFQVGKALYGQ